MNKYTEEFLDECAETLTEADEIQGNKDLMKELGPYMKEKGKRITDIPGDLKQKFQAKLNEKYKEEDEEEEDVAEEQAMNKAKAKMPSKDLA